MPPSLIELKYDLNIVFVKDNIYDRLDVHLHKSVRVVERGSLQNIQTIKWGGYFVWI